MEKSQSECFVREERNHVHFLDERRLCIRSLSCLRSNLLCCAWSLRMMLLGPGKCAGFLIMPKRPYEWRVHSHGCYKFDNALLGLGPRDQSAHVRVFLHLRNTVMSALKPSLLCLLTAHDAVGAR